MTNTNPQKCRWSFTVNDSEYLNFEESYMPHVEKLQLEMSKRTKKFVFQMERGEEKGRLHLQGRMSFKNGKRKSEILPLFSPIFQTMSLRLEGPDEMASSFYCIKQDSTFVDGPWSSENLPLYIPRQVREMEFLYEWQKRIIEMCKVWDTRTINIIYDTRGNIGKSSLCTYMGVNRLAKLLPFCNDYKDILRMCYDVGVFQAYLIDMPRAINKERLFQFFGAIETIKSGYCYDDRYKFTDRYFDCPNLYVFTNMLPDMDMLSLDRWKFWTVTKELALVPYQIEFLGGAL